MQKEVVKLLEPVGITESVEIWLNDLSKEMKNTLSYLLKKGLDDGNRTPQNCPCQVNF